MKLLSTIMCVAVCIALTPGAEALAELRLTPSLSLTETFSDNVDQDPDGEEDAAFLSDLTPGFDLRWQSSRVTASVDGSATFRHQTNGREKGFSVLPELAGFSTVEVSRELFFVDTSAAVSQELINTRRNDVESNQDTVQNYSISPYLVSRFGSFADGELRYKLDQVFGGGSGDGGTGGADEISDATTHTVSAELNSGDDFSRILWSLTGSASEGNRSSDDDVSSRDVALNLEYVIARWISLLGGGGYQKFDDGDPENEIDGPTWEAGVRLRPGPRTDLRVTYGRRDDNESLAADLQYRIDPRTTLTASYSEELETAQQQLARDLGSISTDPNTGQLIDSRTGLPFNPNTSATSLADQTERTRRLRLGLLGTRGRNTFSVEGVVEMSEEEGSGPNLDKEDAYVISANWGRLMSPRSRIEVFGSFERREFDPEGRTDNEFEIGGLLNYTIFTNVNALASYTFNKQISTNDVDEFTENLVSVGVRMTF